MDLDHLRELLQLVAASDVAEVEIEEDDLKIVVRKQSTAPAPSAQPPTIAYAVPPAGYQQAAFGAPGVAPAAGPAPQQPAQSQQTAPSTAGSDSGGTKTEAAATGTEVRAPIVGTFYRRPSPDADPFVKVGDRVSEGDVLCIIEAMKLMNEIEAEVSGTIREILVDDATPVEYDQPLFIVEED